MNKKGTDQIAQMHRLICTFVVHICHKTHFRINWPTLQSDQCLHSLRFHLYVLDPILYGEITFSNFKIITAIFWGVLFFIFLWYMFLFQD